LRGGCLYVPLYFPFGTDPFLARAPGCLFDRLYVALMCPIAPFDRPPRIAGGPSLLFLARKVDLLARRIAAVVLGKALSAQRPPGIRRQRGGNFGEPDPSNIVAVAIGLGDQAWIHETGWHRGEHRE